MENNFNFTNLQHEITNLTEFANGLLKNIQQNGDYNIDAEKLQKQINNSQNELTAKINELNNVIKKNG